MPQRGNMRLCAYAAAFIFCLVAPAAVSEAQGLSVSGCSVSNTGYLSDLAREYERKTGVKVFVRGGGSAAGLDDLQSGRVDFAASCRERIQGDPPGIEYIQVAWDALVFIVHPSNVLENITLENARAIHEGRITNWKQLAGSDLPIKLFLTRPSKGLSGLEKSTRELVLAEKEPVRTPAVLALASSGIVEQMVENTPEGFATAGFSSARKRAVRMLKVSGVQATKANIVSGSYPFSRPLFLLAPRNPKPEVKRFIEYVRGREGQRFISGLGAISLADVK